MDLNDISLQDCPVCGGAAAIFEEGGWAFTIQCCDCGAQTAIATYSKPEDRMQAAQSAAYTWNLGKVTSPNPGE